LCLPGYQINPSGRLVIESKRDIQERGEVSPDDADAFCLTFAQPVAPLRRVRPVREYDGLGRDGWMG
jgi:hypothetical protein